MSKAASSTSGPKCSSRIASLRQQNGARVLQVANDDELTAEDMRIFGEMKRRGRIGGTAELGGAFIARTVAAALEMNL